jgi:hypothetical protein
MDLTPSEQVRAALFAAIVRQSATVSSPDDLLTLAQTWAQLAVEEESEDSSGDYVQTGSTQFLTQDPSLWWAESRRRIGF